MSEHDNTTKWLDDGTVKNAGTMTAAAWRAWFAGQALSNPELVRGADGSAEMASVAVAVADALIERLKR